MAGTGFHPLLKHFSKWVNVKKAKPEDLLCSEITANLRQLVLSGQFNGVFFHVPNEGNAKLGHASKMIRKAIGVIPGAPDYVFANESGVLFVEIKTEKDKLSTSQKAFQKWCNMSGVEYVVCRSWKELEKKLQKDIYFNDKN